MLLTTKDHMYATYHTRSHVDKCHMNKQHPVNAKLANRANFSSYVSFAKTPMADEMLPFSLLDCRTSDLCHIALTVQLTLNRVGPY